MVQAVMQAMGSDGKQWGAADEASLAHQSLTSCCAAHFLTGHRLVPVRSQGIGDPWIKGYLGHCFLRQLKISSRNFQLQKFSCFGLGRKIKASETIFIV